MNNTYFDAKKQVGEHVEKSPEPKKYRLYLPICCLSKKGEKITENDKKLQISTF